MFNKGENGLLQNFSLNVSHTLVDMHIHNNAHTSAIHPINLQMLNCQSAEKSGVKDDYCCVTRDHTRTNVQQ